MKSVKELQTKLSEILYMYRGAGQRFIIETLEMYCRNIEKNKVPILICLIESQQYIDNTSIFLGVNAKDKLEIVCAEIIKRLSKNELSQFKSIIEIDYKNMYFIRGIIYWLKKGNSTFESNDTEELYNEMNESYNTLISNVCENNINIYSKENYSRYNIYCLIDNEKCINQMKKIDENTIFMFLADMISDSVGTAGYGYSINLETFDKLTSYEEVDSILTKIEDNNLNDTEKFIKKVYEKSKGQKSDDCLDDKAIYVDKYVDLRSINQENRL